MYKDGTYHDQTIYICAWNIINFYAIVTTYNQASWPNNIRVSLGQTWGQFGTYQTYLNNAWLLAEFSWLTHKDWIYSNSNTQ